MGGSTSQIGSVDDVKMVNQQGFNDFMGQLGQAMNGFGANMGQSTTAAQNAFGRVNDTATNYNNFLTSMLGTGGAYQNLQNATQNGDPNAAMNSFMSMQPGFNQMAQGALSDVYSTGREQAYAAGDAARRSAANELSAAGLLSSGGAVGAMTEATANPILGMESQLANTRANYLGALQNNAMGNLTSSYGNANQLAAQYAGLGLQGTQGLTNAYATAGQGQSALANLYGGLYGQGLGYGASLNAPEYWQPQYEKNPGFLDYLSAGTSFLGAIKPFGF